MSSNYHIEQKTLNEASRTNNTHTREKKNADTTFKGLPVISLQRELKNCSMLWSVLVFFIILGREDQMNIVYEKK